MKDFDLENLKGRINPQYSNTIGTESYERRLCVDEIESLRQQLAEANAKVAELKDQADRDAKSIEATYKVQMEMTNKIAGLTARLEAQEASEPFGFYYPEDITDNTRVFKCATTNNDAGTMSPLYTTPQPTPLVQAAVAAAIRKAAEVCEGHENMLDQHKQWVKENILAIPHDDSALREIGMRVLRTKREMEAYHGDASVVDRVLGEKK